MSSCFSSVSRIALLVAVPTLVTGTAQAACDTAPANGATITCTGTVGGLDASSFDKVTVRGEQATFTGTLGFDDEARVELDAGSRIEADEAVVADKKLTIVNAGTLAGSVSSTKDLITADDDATITNTGSITALADDVLAILVVDDATITNSGTIRGGIEADDDSTVTNTATGTVIALDRHGIEIDKDGTVTNEGTVRSTSGHGVKIGEGSTLVNRGTVQGGNEGVKADEDGTTVRNWGTIIGGDEGIEGTANLVVENHGTISAVNDAIQADANMTVVNHGTIESTGINTPANPDIAGSAIDIDYGNVDNHGTLRAASSDRAAIDFDQVTTATNTTTITNRAGARIEGGYGIFLDAADRAGDRGAKTIDNWGTIVGTNGTAIVLGASADAYTAHQGSVTTGLVDLGAGDDSVTLFAGATVSGDLIGGDGQDRLVLTAATADTSATLSNTLSGFESLEIGTGTWSVDAANGFETLAVGATGGLDIRAAGGFATLQASQSVTLDGALVVDVDATGAGDSVTSAGTATLGAGATLQVRAAAGAYGATTTYTVVSATGGLTGTFASVSDTMAFLDSSLGYTASEARLTLTRNGTGFGSVGATPNQQAVGNALNSATGTALYGQVVTLDQAGAQAAFQQLAGDVHPTSGTAALGQGQQAQTLLSERMSHVFDQTSRGSGGRDVPSHLTSYADTPVSQAARAFDAVVAKPVVYDVWARGHGSWSHLDGKAGIGGANTSSGGVMMGLDASGGDFILGAGIGYARSDMTLKASNASADIDTFQVAAYGGYVIDPLRLSAGATLGLSRIHATRQALGETPKADYDALSADLFVEAAYRAAAGRFAFEPFLRASYSLVHSQGFTEKNAPVSGLTVASQTYDVPATTLGLRVSGQDLLDRLSPHAGLAWRHAYGDLTPSSTATFLSTGTSFTGEGLPIARDTLEVSLGADYRLTDRTRLSLDYAGAFADGAYTNRVELTGRLRF